MAVPKFYEFFGSFLRAVDDGKVHKSKDVQKSIAVDMNLSDEDMAEQLPSQRQATYVNRINWARTYLDKAGLITTPSRGHYQITDEGHKALQSGETIDLNYLDRYESFRQFHTVNPSGEKQPQNVVAQPEEEEKTPSEIMSAAFDKMNASLAGDLMDMVMGLEPTEFETLVVKLLLKMGYGYGIEDAGKVTRATGDGGIDGIIKEDQLGFNNIYIQAKKWSADHKVSRPEVQKFAGALQGEKASKGLFITTSEFTKDAQVFASMPNSRIVLVDGNQLTKLMIKYNLGVAVEQTFEVKRIDSDFFSEDL